PKREGIRRTRDQNTEPGGRPFPAQACFQRPDMPLPSIPGLIDLPAQAEIARQLGELRFVQVFETGDAVGGESVLCLKLAMSFSPHELAVLALLVKWAVEHHDAAAGAQASPRFGQCAVIV